jgi:orotate phosphoribosyltransferase
MTEIINKKEKLGKEIIELLYEAGLIKFFPKDNRDGWTLHSGEWSPFYIQLRPIFSTKNCVNMMNKIGDGIKSLIDNEIPGITKLVGVASAGVPISVIVSYKSKIPLCYTRRVCNARTLEELEAFFSSDERCELVENNYGEHSFLEGILDDSDNLLIVDDLITDGESKLIAKKIVEFEAKKQKKEILCNSVAVIIDREQGGKEELIKHGITSNSIIPFKTKGIHWLNRKIGDKEYELILDYYDNPDKYQDKHYRDEILATW